MTVSSGSRLVSLIGTIVTVAEAALDRIVTEPVMELFLQRAGLAIRAIDYAPDHLHVGFICDKSKPDPEASPCPEDVRDFFREIRAVHNRVPLS